MQYLNLVLIAFSVFGKIFPDTLKISRSYSAVETRSFNPCPIDSAEISVIIEIKIADSLPLYSFGGNFKFDTIVKIDTEMTSFELIKSKQNETNTFVQRHGYSRSSSIKDAVIMGKNGKAYGYGIYDTLNLYPMKSQKVHFDLKGKIIPWGLHKTVAFSKEFNAKADTLIVDKFKEKMISYKVKFITHEKE